MASAAVSSASTSTPSLCANCDEATALYSCADCPDDLTATCAACCQQLHKPARTQRHRLRIIGAAIVAAAPDSDDFAPATEGHGFCDACAASSADGPLANLAVLHCEGCGSSNNGLCMVCDTRVHAHLSNDAHTRIFFHDAASSLELQSASFILAGFRGEQGEGMKIQFQDSMASYAGRIWPGSMLLARYMESLCAKKDPDPEQQQQSNASSSSSSSSSSVDYFRNKTVIELGAGCAAIPSLTAWLLGARACLATDMNEDGLQILEANFEQARKQVDQQRAKDSNATTDGSSTSEAPKPMGLLSSRRLAFGDDTPDLVGGGGGDGGGGFDIVLGSYILYDPDSFVPLAYTLSQLLTTPHAVALLTSHEPTRESALLEALAARGLVAVREPFSLQSAQLSDETHADACSADSASGSGRGSSNLGTGLRSTSILIVRRKAAE